MRALFIVLTSLLCSHSFLAQVSIAIVDEDVNAVPQAKVFMQSISDSSRVYHSLSNWDGVSICDYSLNAKIILKIHAQGFETFQDTVLLKAKNVITLQKIQNLEEMVVTGQIKATSLESSVQKIEIISSDQIQKSGAVNLSEVLVYKTNIRINQDNILGSSMEIGGASGQNVKILIDGVPVIGRQNGNIDLSQINLSNVERIEIVEGPLSFNYGTNALAGTINIIMKKQVENGLNISIAPYYESSGVYNLTGAINYRKGNGSLSFNGGRNYFDGWSRSDPFLELPKETLADTNRVKTWKPKEQYVAGASYTYAHNKWQSRISGTYFQEEILNRGFPKAPYYESAFDDYYRTKRADFVFSNDFQIKSAKLKVLLAYNYYHRTKSTYVNDLTTLNQVLSESDGAQDTSRFDNAMARIEFNAAFSQKLEYQIGLDLYQYTGWGKRIFSGKQDIGDYAGFATLDWRITDSLVVKPGLRYAYNTKYQSPVIPSLNVLYRVKKLSFRGAIAKGFRAPDLKEIYMDFVDVNHNITGNSELKPESSWNYSFNLNWMNKVRENGMVKVELSSAFNDITNLITLAAKENGDYTYVNVGDYSSFTNKFKLIYRMQRISIMADFAYVGRYNQLSESTSLNQYEFSPELGVNAEYQIVKQRLSVNVFYKFNGSLSSYSINNEEEVETRNQDSYSILDISLTASFLKRKNLTATLGVKNLLNVQTVNVVGQVQSTHTSAGGLNVGKGTTAFLSLKYNIEIKKK